MNAITVRDARPGDGAGLAALWTEVAEHFLALDPEFFQLPDPAGLDEWFEEILARPRDGRLLVVAELDDTVVGELVASLREARDTGHRQVQRDFTRRTAHIDLLVVAERLRRQGIGQALMATAHKWADAEGAAAISLETDLRNPSSMAFYEKTMGYVRQTVTFRTVL